MQKLVALACVLAACSHAPAPKTSSTSGSYLDYEGREDFLSGGARMIPIDTPKGKFKVWTKRVGNNPKIKVLLLHGGPAMTHEYFEAADSFFPAAGIEYYYYDQLGSGNSDHPDADELWDLPRFVEEVEQVRTALGLTKDNFYLVGHSWGGLLATEYALKYQQNLKGLVISNMMASVPAYNEYAHKTLMPSMPKETLAEIEKFEAAKDYDNPKYMELLIPSYYTQHILRIPADAWPEPVTRSFSHLNKKIYTLMQGPSEMGASGRLENWDRMADLSKITVPTLVIAGRFDTMDPKYMESMSKAVKHGQFLLCPQGSHLSMYDDQDTYFRGLVRFILDVDANNQQVK